MIQRLTMTLANSLLTKMPLTNEFDDLIDWLISIVFLGFESWVNNSYDLGIFSFFWING